MAGIYLHIPFCKQACVYCDFHFSTSVKNKAAVVQAMVHEIDLQKRYLGAEVLQSIYFGGGTPSLLSAEELELLLNKIHQTFTVSPKAEITLEANPDDLNQEKLSVFKKAGVNRLSIGIQSFREQDLRFMNRSHNAEQASASVKLAQDMGISNISIDLIYATPGLSPMAWESNLRQAIDLQVPHISAYSLTVEPKTALHHNIEKGISKAPEEEMAETHFNQLSVLTQAGFEHYEISNLAKPGQRAVHNSSYWQRKAYLGIGPSAHSFNGNARQWNVANNTKYIKSLEQNQIPKEEETLSQKDAYNEYIMTNLRRTEGVNLGDVQRLFGEEKMRYLQKEAKPELTKGNLVLTDTSYGIPTEKRFYSDGIAAALFYL